MGGNPEEVSQFGRIRSRKSLFAKSKLANLKNSGGEGGGSEKYIYSNPSVWSFSGITHTQERRLPVPCMSSTWLSRLGLPSLIYSRSTLHHQSEKSINSVTLPILVNFTN